MSRRCSLTWGNAAATALARVLQAIALDAAAEATLRWSQLLLTPDQDVIQWAVQFAPYRSREVVWQGHRANIDRGTECIPLQPGYLGDAALRAPQKA